VEHGRHFRGQGIGGGKFREGSLDSQDLLRCLEDHERMPGVSLAALRAAFSPAIGDRLAGNGFSTCVTG
jgi:hypothetical protein